MGYFKETDLPADIELPAISAGAKRLQVLSGVVGVEQDLARSPLFAASRNAASDSLEAVLPVELGALYGRPFNVIAHAGWPVMRDLLLLCDVTSHYAKQGCPDSCRVFMSADDLCRAAGYPGKGGWQMRAACESLMRLRSLTFMYTRPAPGDRFEACIWGPIESGWVRSGSTGGGCVRISPRMASLVRQGRVVYLDRAVLHRLFHEDPYAARLWTFLESESFPHPLHRYRLFSAPEGEPPEYTHTPAVADLLWLSRWSRRRKARERIEQAAGVVNALDPRYRLSVELGNVWSLCIRYGHPEEA